MGLTGRQYAALVKSGGVITPAIQALFKNAAANFAIDDTLEPGKAGALIDLVVDQSDFLKRVATIKCQKLITPLNVYALSNRKAIRITEGTAPTVANAADNEGKNMTLLGFDLPFDLYYSAIDDNADNPGFEKMIELMIAKQLANDILDLGTNGTDDDYTADAFLEINEGWVHLAKNAANSVKVDTGAAANILASFDLLIAAMGATAVSKFLTKDMCFIVNTADAETFKGLMAPKNAGGEWYKDGSPGRYMGYEVVVNPYMTTGTYLFCNPLDLAYGVGVNDIRRSREDVPREKSIQITYNLMTDYELIRDRAVCIGYDIVV